ncbi:PH domain-containing protein [Exiguobacterium sp. s193]|uniref:PH domain-containing protein n=1 Tax=Exiguobacterium sp. s193 TaxID=2751207 RepID=UPI001BEB4957|nr:PH domain-containing protein [Exiguobacterium sp. s193]
MQSVILESGWQRLSIDSVKVERQYVALRFMAYALLIAVMTTVQMMWLDLSPWWMWIVAGVVAVLFILKFYYIPRLRYDYFRYQVDEEFLIVRSGVIFHHIEIVPLVKVQFIDTSTGPLLRRAGLMNIQVNTASGFAVIHRLEERRTIELRRHVERFAKLEEQEEESL